MEHRTTRKVAENSTKRTDPGLESEPVTLHVVKHPAIVRPSVFGIFLGMAYILIGLWMFLNSSMRILEEDKLGVSKLIDARIEMASQDKARGGSRKEIKKAEKTTKKTQKKVDKAEEKVNEEFSAEILMEEMSEFHEFKKIKIHHVVALLVGFVLAVIGIVLSVINVISIKRAWKKVHSVKPDQTIVFKPNFSSRIAGWLSLIVGLGLLIPSYLSLNKLIWYREESPLTALFNMFTMLHLSEHYRFLLVLGFLLSIAGLLVIPYHYLAVRRSRKKQIESRQLKLTNSGVPIHKDHPVPRKGSEKRVVNSE